MATKTYEKLIDEIGGMSVLELADFVKALEEKFGVKAAAVASSAPAAGAAAQADAPKAAEKAEFKVTLKESGAEKMKAIKALRKVLPTLGLTEAKTMVENAPSVLGDAIAKDKAMEIKKELEEAGAKVELA